MSLLRGRAGESHPVADTAIMLVGALACVGLIVYSVMSVREYARTRTLDTDELIPLSVFWFSGVGAFAYRRWRQLKDEVKRRTQAEQTLRESEKKYRDLVETVPVGIVVSSFDGRVVEVNDTLVRMHGYESKEEFLKSGVSDRFSDLKDRERLVAAVWDAGKADGFEAETRRKDGSVFWTSTTAVPRTTETGEQQLIGVIQDITNRRVAEDALRTSELKYRSLFTHMLEGFAHCRMVFQGGQPWDFEYLDVNARFEELTGLHDVVGKRVSDVIPGIRESNSQLLETYARVALTGNPEKIETYLAPLDAWYSVSIYSPQKEYFVAVFEVITQRKQAENALRQSEVRYRDLADSISDVFFAMDCDMKYTYWNKASEQLTGIPATEALGKDFFDIFPENEVTTRLRATYLEAIATRRAQHLVTAYPGGKSLIHEISAYPSDLGLCVFVKDITEREKAQTALRESEGKFRDLAEQSPNMIFINKNGHVVYANKKCTDVMGYGLDELYSPDFDFLSLVNLESRALVTTNFRAHAEGHEVRPYEYSLVTKNGETIEGILSSKLVSYGDGRAILGTVTDITERKQAERALRESEQKYRDLMDNLPVGIVITSMDGRVIEVNKTLTQMHGYDSKAEFANSAVADRFYDLKDRERWVASLRQKGKTDGFEIQTKRRDGSLFWTSLTSIPRTAETGEEQLITVSQDITERKMAEDALLFKNALLEAQAESTTEGILAGDDENRIVLFNRRFLELWQVPEGLIETSDAEAVLRHTLTLVDNPESFMQRVADLSERRDEKGEDIVDLRDGRSISRYSRPLVDAKGAYRGRIWYFRDITEPRRLREKIEHAAEEWRRTFDSITEAVSIQDKDFKLVRVNRAYADMFGMRPQELLGKSCYELVHGTDCPMEGCPHLKTLQTGVPAREEFFEPHLGIHLEVTTSPIFNEKGEVEGTVLVARDITKRREMEQKLLLSDRLASIGELAAGVAHEVNNPLTTVIGFSELLMERMTDDDTRNDLILVHNEAKRAAAIVRNLLTFARQHELEKQPTRIQKVIEDVLELRAYEQKVSNIEVITKFAPDLPEIVVDYFQMHQVFLNLVINAEYFMKESHDRGTLTLVTSREGDMVRISVADDGPGIRAENLRHVFDPFFTTKEVGKGTGLGLSICHGIVTEHGGRIYAESETGKGATFVVELPIG